MPAVSRHTTVEAFYKASARQPQLVTVPGCGFLMVDGRGDPNHAPEYREAVEALYSLSYALKFSVKKAGEGDYKVGPLEGLWWSDDIATFSVDRKDEWHWTLLIAQPDLVTADRFERIRAEVAAKKPLPGLARTRLEHFDEGACAQILHVGPFSDEGPTIARLHEFIEAQGGGLRGTHHEIYLSDIRRADPAKWRTIIRQPLEP